MPETDQPAASRKPAPPSRRLRRWAIGLIALLAVLITSVVALTRPAVLTPLLQRQLAKATGVHVTLSEARLAWPDRLTLRDLAMALPESAPPNTQSPSVHETNLFLRVKAITLDWDWRTTSLAEVSLDAPEAWLTEDTDRDVWPVTEWFSQRPQNKQKNGPRRWPAIDVTDGVIHRQVIEAGQVIELGDLLVEGRIQPRLVDQQVELSANVTPSTHSQTDDHETLHETIQVTAVIDQDTQTLTCTLPRISYGPELNRLMPTYVAKFAQDANVGGVVEKIELKLELSNEGPQFQTDFELADGQIDLIYIDRSLRLEDVRGGCRISENGLAIQDLTGRAEDITYIVNGQIQGRSLDAPFDLTIDTQPFDLRQGTDIFPLPELPAVRELHERINATGQIRFFARGQRTRAGDAPLIEGGFQVIDVRATPMWFPYPVEQITGWVRFDNERLTLEDIQGVGVHGGRFTGQGWVAPLAGSPDYQLDFETYGFPIQDPLLRAMPEGVEAYVREHLYEPAQTHGLDPVILRRGDLTVARFGGQGKPYRMTIDADANGLVFEQDGVPGPVISQSGRLQIERYGMTIHDAHVIDAVHQHARGELHGRVTARASTGSATLDHALSRLVPSPNLHAFLIPRQSDRGNWQPTLYAHDIDLEVNDTTRAQLVKPVAEVLADLNLQGRAEGTVLWSDDLADRAPRDQPADKQSRWPFTLYGDLLDASLTPYNAGNDLTAVSASFTAEEEQVSVNNLEGNWVDALLTGRCDVDLRPQGTEHQDLALNLDLSLQDATIDTDWLATLPSIVTGIEETQAVFEQQALSTTGDLKVSFRSRAGPSEKLRLHYEPRRTELFREQTNIAFDQMTGALFFDGKTLRIQELAGQLPGARLQTSGVLRGEGLRDLDLTLSATIDRWSDPVQATLPDSVRRALDRFKISGPLTVDNLRLQRTQDQAVRAEGDVTLRGVSGDFLFPIAGVQGAIDFDWTPDAPELCRVELIDLEGTWAQRPFSALNTLLQTAADQDHQLLITPLTATVCGGDFNAHGWIDLKGQSQFGLDATLTGADWQTLLPDDAAGRTPANTAQAKRGLFSAQLAMTGPTNTIEGLNGRCHWRLDDVWVMNRPILMTVLSVASLSLPQQQAFNRLEGRFWIDNKTAHVEQLAIISPQVVMLGTGTANWPAQTVDLVFAPVNPRFSYLTGVTEFVELVRGQIYRISVDGEISDLKARVTPIPAVWGVAKSIVDVFSFGGSAKASGASKP